MSFPYHVRGIARVILGRKWGHASGITNRRQCMERGPDWPTIVKRGQDAMRGAILREGATFRADGSTHWRLVRSWRGRRNQVDIVVNGLVWRTGSLRSGTQAIRWQKWPAHQRIAA